jgi:hypothetical protein
MQLHSNLLAETQKAEYGKVLVLIRIILTLPSLV